MKRLILLFLFTGFLIANAQHDSFNTEAFWSKLQLHHKLGHAITASDTSIIVITNRARKQDPLRFMDERRDGSRLQYFFVYTREGKWHVLPVKDLQEALQYMPDKNRDWVIYTEGMGKLFTTDIHRALALSGQYQVNVLLMDYPSITTTKGRIGNYKFALNNARIAYKDFLPALNMVRQLRSQNMMGTGRLSMFFHSMGNNVVTQLIFNNKLPLLNDVQWIDNLILNAPCVPQKKHAEWLSNIKFAKHIFVHYNPEDYTLSGAHFLSLRKQLGEKIENPIFKKAYYINFNTLAGEGHSNFLSLPGREPATAAAIRHYHTLLHGDTVQLNNATLYRPTAYKNIGWDILPTD